MATSMTEGPSGIRIALGGGHAARLFGLPFLLVGGWLAYHLVAGGLELATGRARLAETAFGMVLLAVVTVAFVAPGWLLVASRAVVDIDRMAGTVTRVRDLRVYRHRRTWRLSGFSRLEVDVLATSSGPRRRTRSTYQIALVGAPMLHRPPRQTPTPFRSHAPAPLRPHPPTPPPVIVGLFDDGDEAVEFARRLSGLLGVPVEDLRGIDPSDELPA